MGDHLYHTARNTQDGTRPIEQYFFWADADNHTAPHT